MHTTESFTHTASGPPTLGDAAVEIVPLISTVAVAGPPVIAAWVGTILFALLLAGPFALIATLVVVLAVAAALVAVTGVILATPYLLIRHLGRRRSSAASVRPAAEDVHLLGRPGAVAGHRPVLELLQDRVGVS
jgi:hypothetical protein